MPPMRQRGQRWRRISPTVESFVAVGIALSSAEALS
jgi:hypothetical protein